MIQPARSSPDRPIPNPQSPSLGWDSISPDLKAAITVALVVVLLEVLSDVVPLVGFVATLPFAMVTYYVQGILAGRFLKRDPRYPAAGAGLYLRSGLVSAFWTAVVFSTAVTLVDAVLLTPLTLGAFLAALPLVLASSLIDILLNFILTLAGAWLYSQLGPRGLAGVSCALLTLLVAVLCLGSGLLVFGGISLLHHLSLFHPGALL